jgi:carboxypeptidase C (cathepsin A)
MRRFSAFIALALLFPVLASADDPAAKSAEGSKPAEKKEEKKDEADKPKEKAGSAVIAGAEVKYLTLTGQLPIFKEDGSPRGNVFYVYYAVTDKDGKRLSASNPGGRPITFCFNGGPGSAAVWLHFGGLGPKRVDLPPDGLAPATVAKIVDNPNSILDVSDLVFIDPVGTGISRAAKGEKPEQFFGVDEDIGAIGEFVRLFTTREQRWESPKYLCGESYGVFRASGLVNYLQETHGMYFQGLVLLSGLVSYQTISADFANDLPFILALPTLTATAHYHKKLPPDLAADYDKAVRESRAFANGDYSLALLKGNTIAPDERKRIGGQLARFTGLSLDLIDDADLRIHPSLFREHLLRAEGKILGRYDARVISEDTNRLRSEPEFDPSFTNVIGPFSAATNAYLRGTLGYESDLPYRVLTHLHWSYAGFAGRYASTAGRLAESMKTNPQLRLLILVGRRDLAVPPDTMRYSIDHLDIPAALRPRITWSEFDSGHMMYLLRSDAEKLRADLAGFITVAP